MQDRVDILRGLDSGETAAILANKYGVTPSAIYKIKSNKEKILASEKTIIESHGSLKKKRAPLVEQSDLDQALYLWFRQKRSRGDPVSGPVLKEKALQLNEKLQGSSSFKATDGYLKRFKERHGIHHISVQGERLSADKQASEKFGSSFYEDMQAQGYTMDEIYNADETGLWWKSLPRKTFATSMESRADGFKVAKDRITLMVCANASGTHKLPLFAIGKSAKPRCFKHIQAIPIKYTGQKSAWMDRQKFVEWYTELFLPEIEAKHGESGRKCILLLDNAPTHPSAEILNSLSDKCKVVYMPPNVTSLIQPMDQGVIEKLKKVYRKYFLREFLINESTEATQLEFLKGWNILKCLLYTAKAWETLTADNLRKAWKNLFPVHFASDNTALHEEVVDSLTFTSMVQRSSLLNNVTESEAQAWLQEDATDHGWPLLSDEQILSPEDEMIIEEIGAPQDEDETEEDEATAFEALQAFDKFQAWFQERWDFQPEDWKNVLTYRETAITVALNEKFPGRLF